MAQIGDDVHFAEVCRLVDEADGLHCYLDQQEDGFWVILIAAGNVIVTVGREDTKDNALRWAASTSERLMRHEREAPDWDDRQRAKGLH